MMANPLCNDWFVYINNPYPGQSAFLYADDDERDGYVM